MGTAFVPTLSAPLAPLMGEMGGMGPMGPMGPMGQMGQMPPEQPPSDPERETRWMQHAEGIYGALFPLLANDPEIEQNGVAWREFAEDLWESVSTLAQRPVWMALRNREMRHGNQWIDSRGFGPWVKAPHHPEAVRATWNMIGPALDMHDETCSEQRPGFRVSPKTLDKDSARQAEAQQLAGEFAFDQQQMSKVLREFRYWAGTDGVVFPMTYWDPDAGPEHTYQDGTKLPAGDPRTCVFTIEQVRVSAGASANERPVWWVVREVIPLAQAVAEHGEEVAAEYPSNGLSRYGTPRATFAERGRALSSPVAERGGLSAYDGANIDRWWIFCEKNPDLLPGGLSCVVVGDVLVSPPEPLRNGVVPIYRVTDGSTDPSWYAEPRMSTWVEFQMQVNVGISKWIESLRRQANGQLLARSGAINVNTLMAGLTRLIEVDTHGPVSEAVQAMPTVSVGADLKEFLALAIKGFEDRSGWNDVSRGQFATGTSGRAILAVREQLERTFAPGVNAMSEGAVEWLKVTLAWMGWGYDIPRMIALTGSNRSDLALELSRNHFTPVGSVTVDPESMMPMPRALRLFVLEDALAKGIISREEYRRRYPYASLQNMDSPDTDHLARAKRVASAIKEAATGQPIPIPEVLWMDDESTHQDVLQRELILNDDAPPQARQMAYQRWMQLAQQALLKQAVLAPAPPPTEGGSSRGGKGPSLSPRSQPLLASNPGLAAGPPQRVS